MPNRREFIAAAIGATAVLNPSARLAAGKRSPRTPQATAPAGNPSKAYGSGYFGNWIEDQFGLPAYAYTCDQIHDAKAVTPVYRAWRAPTDHTHQVGNDRLIGAASNYGYVQVRQDEGSPKFLNDYAPERGHYGGGIGYFTDGSVILSTFYPGNAEKFERTFGMGYIRKKVLGHGYVVDQFIFAPFGDDPVLISQVSISNNGSAQVEARWIEYWSCQMYQFSFRSYMEATIAGNEQKTPELRRDFAERFVHHFRALKGGIGLLEEKSFKGRSAAEVRAWQEVQSQLAAKPVGWLKAFPEPLTKETDMEDLDPPATFLVSLDAPADGFATDGRAFFGSGDVDHPTGLRGRLKGDLRASGPEASFLLERRIPLNPGETRTLYFAYGYLPEGFDLDSLVAKYRKNASRHLEESSAQWKKNRCCLSTETEPWVGRELTWHNYYLRSGATYDSFFRQHITSQGGFYQYLQGFQGEAMDVLQHALPLVFSCPELAKNVLRYTLEETQPDGSIPYGITGRGALQAWRVVPDDQELWVLWLASEYVLGTRDRAFLGEKIKTYPVYGPNAGSDTVGDLLLRYYRRLKDNIGTGPHGLVRLLNADWWDSLDFWARRSGYAVGAVIPTAESVLSSAMATYVLDHYANVLRYTGEANLAEEVSRTAHVQRDAVRAQWRGKWFPRAWLSAQKGWIGEKDLWLEPQSWAIVGGSATPPQRGLLIQAIDELLRRPSPIGAMRIAEGEDLDPGEDGRVWTSLNTILIWALAQQDLEMDSALAWDEWKNNSLARHAEVYPEIWYGIWSGADYFNSVLSKYPGQVQFDESLLDQRTQAARAHSAGNAGFNATDFPVMNMHRHANPLYSVTKLLGIEFNPKGLSLRPALPLKEYCFRCSLVGLTKSTVGYEGWYAPLESGRWTVSLRIPESEAKVISHLEINDELQLFQRTPEGDLEFSGESTPDRPLRWSIRV
jgi:hypothetical protein